MWCTTAVTVVGLKCEMLSGKRMRSELQYPAVVMVVGVKYEISDSVTVVLRAPGEDLGSLCWGIRLSQSKPFHIIGQGHLLSGRSGEAFPTNATQLARSSILCFTALLLALNQLHLSFSPSFFFFFYPCFFSPPLLSLIFCTSSFSFSYWLRIGEVCDRPLYTALEK